MRLEELVNEEQRLAADEAATMRVEAADLEDRVKALKEKAAEKVGPVLAVVGDHKVVVPGAGTFSLQIRTPTSFDQDKAKMRLGELGVSAAIIRQAFEDATTVGASQPSVRFVRERERERR